VELIEKKNSKYWWYDFTVRGERFRGSTKETNETRASMIASIRLNAAMQGSDPLPGKVPTLRAFSRRFLEWVDQAKLAPKTETYYKNGWRLLAATKLAGMRLDKIEDEQAAVVSFPGGAANRNCALRTLRRLQHLAEAEKIIRRAPKLKLATEYERQLRLDEITEKKLLAGAACCKWRKRTLALFTDIVVLMRDAGMRNERELFQVRIENIDWDKRLIFVPDSKTPAGRREVPMSDRVYELLRVRCGSRTAGWLFPAKHSESGHLTTIAKHFRQARRAAGLPEALVLYCARHDFGTRVQAITGNLKAVMLTMGHKDVKTAMKYQHPDLEIVRAALNGRKETRAGGD